MAHSKEIERVDVKYPGAQSSGILVKNIQCRGQVKPAFSPSLLSKGKITKEFFYIRPEPQFLKASSHFLEQRNYQQVEETQTNGNFVTHIITDRIRDIYDRENHETKGN